MSSGNLTLPLSLKSIPKQLEKAGYVHNYPNVRMSNSLRSMSYDTRSACADIVDNSIDARATKIRIEIITDKADDNKTQISKIRFIDNGLGMTRDELDEALKLGSASEKEKNELGVFGMGLKSASLSQGRKVSVITQSTDDECYYSAQDLDVMLENDMWLKELRIATTTEKSGFKSPGTLVEISKLDRLDYKQSKALESALIKHMATTFRRFLKSKKFQLLINDIDVQPIDPVTDNDPTLLGETEIEYENAKVTIKLYELRDYGIQENRQRGIGYKLQGFHIFRNNREIMDGQTLDFFVKHNKYNQFRGEIYFDGNLDSVFSTDIKKSGINIKQDLRDKIQSFAMPYINSLGSKHNKKSNIAATENVDLRNVSKMISDKLNLIEMPKAEVEKRNPAEGTPQARKSPSDPTGKPRTPKNNKKLGFANNVDFEFSDLGDYGPIWRPSMSGRKIKVELNRNHRFIITHILPLYENGQVDSFNAVLVLLMALSNFELKLSEQSENFDVFEKMRFDVGSEVMTILS